ncbi:MAG: GxxExxY protein [Acidobacteria bacterium]|jgi:GxxExxY protein|nr:GxxExxY protein [Acidobacteriota bacterium]
MFYRSSVAERVIGCAIEVHRAVGPGLMESAYQACLTQELRIAGLDASREEDYGFFLGR